MARYGGGLLKVLFCASEVTPFAKTGGLADVAGTLPLALADEGVEFLITMPKYRGIERESKKLREGVTVRFVAQEEYFNRASLYGNEKGDYPDNLKRFVYFCRESLRIAQAEAFKPDIVHANDWQTALLPVLLRTEFKKETFFKKTKSLLTLHNVAYQGTFGYSDYLDAGLDEALFNVDGFEFYGRANLLKGGILYADAVNTVSPTYASEILTRDYGFGLDGVLKRRESVLSGILNGIDTDFWNPGADKRIEAAYTVKDLSGKQACKAALQKSSGLEVNPAIPVFAVVSRLAEQKGIELFSEIADAFLNGPVQFVLLGEGDAVYHTMMQNIGKRHPQNTAIHLGFNAAEAHRIYAGADFFMMPSFYEPCGLGQMISLRYGTIPVVRHTGGLADTVVDWEEDAKTGNGIVFRGHSPEKLLEALNRALKLYADSRQTMMLRKHGMKTDFSWHRSAKEYKKLYQVLCGKETA